jgi:DNA repair protein RadC
MDLFSNTLTLEARPDRAQPASSPMLSVEDRAAQYGAQSMADYELLTLLLARPCGRNADGAARQLLQRFGDLPGVLGADMPQVAGIVGSPGAVALAIVHETLKRASFAQAAKAPVISSWSALVAYVKVAFAARPREVFHVLFLDKKNRLIADEQMGVGTVDHAPVYPREIMRRALELNASGLILVHNHPSGDPTPSSADVEMTRRVVEAARALGLGVHDHLIAGRDGVASLKALGVM